MSFFSRGNQQPPAPPSQYSRVAPADPMRTGPSRVPASRHEDPSAYEKRSYDRRPPQQGRGGVFQVKATPEQGLAVKNVLVVNPADFPHGQHVLVNRSFPLTTYHDTTPGNALPSGIPPGWVGVSSIHRLWIGLSLNGDSVTIEAFQQSPAYLQSLDLEVGFFAKKFETAEMLSTEEMTKSFLRGHGNVMFTVGEQLLFDFRGIMLKAMVKGVQVVELPGQSNATANYGILMEKTDITFLKEPTSPIKLKGSARKAPPNAILAPNFKFEDMGIGGLDQEFSAIFRRAFASRVFPPALVERLGISHVKGILLFGPPGTGKTLMARQIGKMLNAREPKIVNGPEILNKYVGASEENIRKLFADAEKEYKEKGDESGLHIIIFDELDAICKQRGSTGGGTGVGDSVVNQLLSKMDGVDQLNNILLIGMTNRLDMIDEALLRPGRLEVHMEISLPDENGRVQILDIHTAKMRQNGIMDHDVDIAELAALTKNFSGAEISGLVKSATSFAFSRHVKVGTLAGISDDIENLRVNRNDFMNALEEVQPAFGVAKEEMEQVVQNGIIHYSKVVDEILRSGELYVEQVRTSTRTPLVSVLLHGPPGSGKTAMAATIAQASQYPFMKLLSPDSMVGFSESQKVAAIAKVFQDSYKSPLSVIVIDNLERLLDFTPIGPRFSNTVLQTLMVVLARRPPKGRRLLIIATSSVRSVLNDFGLFDIFDDDVRVPPISTLDALDVVLREVALFPNDHDYHRAIDMLGQVGFGQGDDAELNSSINVGIKKLLGMIEMARQEPEAVAERLTSALMGLGM